MLSFKRVWQWNVKVERVNTEGAEALCGVT